MPYITYFSELLKLEMAKKEAGLSFDDVMLNLKQGKFSPVYFLCGEETYFIDEISDFIANSALNENDKAFNQTIAYGKDLDVPTLLSAAKRFPMMAERQVVIVKEAQEIKKLEDIESYISNPMLSTILVVCYKYKKPDGRGSFAKTLKKEAIYFEADKMYDNQLPGWIGKYVKQHEYKISDQAIQLLADNIGNHLHSIVNALDKLIILLPPKGEITPKLIEENIGISKDFNVFELQKAVGEKNILRVNQIANYFAANEKDNPLVVTIGILYGFFSKIMLFHYLPDKSKMSVAGALKINPFFYDDYARAAKNYSASKTLRIVSYLREYDLKSKGLGATGAVSAGAHLRELLFKIMH